MHKLIPLIALAFAACSTSPADDYKSVLPDDRLIMDSLDAETAARGVGTPSDYFLLTHQVVRDTNTTIGDVLGLVSAITEFDPTWSEGDKKALWGPWLDNGHYGQLYVQQLDDASYVWAIELRPEDSEEDAWVGVVTGQVAADSTEIESNGWFYMDLTAIDTAEAGDGTLGEFGCAYSLSESTANADVAFGEISEDGGLPADALYHFEHTKGEGGLLDIALDADISDPPNGTAEIAVIRSRWNGEGAGRADSLITEGDAGASVFAESDCWDGAHQTVYFESNVDLLMEGDKSACVFGEASFNE